MSCDIEEMETSSPIFVERCSAVYHAVFHAAATSFFYEHKIRSKATVATAHLYTLLELNWLNGFA
jgi:hypothetical protein